MADLKDIPIVDVAIALNLVADIIDKLREDHGVELTPENIGEYVAERKKRRDELNKKLGITEDSG